MDKVKLELTEAGVAALTETMRGAKVEGRTEIRNHSRIMRSLMANCSRRQPHMVMLANGTMQKDGEDVLASSGVVELEEKEYKYLKETCDAKFKAGVSGINTMGYEDLIDALDKADKQLETPVAK